MLRAVLNKSTAVRPFTSHLANHSSRRARHAGHCWRNNDEIISNVLRLISTYGHAILTTKKLRSSVMCGHWMPSRNPWRKRERVKGISTPWWWLKHWNSVTKITLSTGLRKRWHNLLQRVRPPPRRKLVMIFNYVLWWGLSYIT